VQKPWKCLVIFALATAVILSCGIPTSIPILPKEVVVKASPSVSVPLGKVNYNLYSGLSGGNMNEKFGSLENLLGASWLTDLEEQGAKIYDYRPAGSEDTQQFLIHYKLNMEDTLGVAGEFDLSEYRDMIDELTGMAPQTIDDVLPFDIPKVEIDDTFEVNISLDEVTGQISDNLGDLGDYIAYLPVENATHYFPDLMDFPGLPTNSGQTFSVTLPDLDSLTLTYGKLSFVFTLTYGRYEDPLPHEDPPPQGTTLKISDFTLRPKKDSQSSIVVTNRDKDVVLNSSNSSDSTFIEFNAVRLKEFDLVCKLEITGSALGFFSLDITPAFDAYTISGVEGLVLTAAQLDSLRHDFEGGPYTVGDEDLGPSFQATVGTGNLKIDTKELFPPLSQAKDNEEGWNLKMNLSGHLKQEDAELENGEKVQGLPHGGSDQPLHSGDNDLEGKILNNQDVNISGTVTIEIPEEDKLELEDGTTGGKLTFQNFPGGITKGDPASYEKDLKVNLDVSEFSKVTVLAEDIGLDSLTNIEPIEQELGDDFTSFKPWLNYLQFEEGGLGAVLTIEKLNIPEGMGLYIDVSDLGLGRIFQPLVNLKDPTGAKQDNARLTFTNEDTYKLEGKKLPDILSITVELGFEPGTAAQDEYEASGLLTLEKVVPGTPIEMTNIKAGMVFNWAAISVKPEPHVSEGSDDPLPDYPFTGTFPEEGEDGIDLSGIPKGLVFYIPEEGDGGISANLYISLKRQKQLSDGVWVDEAADDPGRDGYKETDPNGWSRNLKVNLPSLDFRARQGDKVSENLFAYNPNEEKSTGEWALFKPLNLEAPEFAEQGMVTKDDDNEDNPFMIYTGSTLPEPNKDIPIGKLAEVFNKNLIGEENLYFEYTMELSSLPDHEDGAQEPGEIILYPEMLEKRVLVSVDLLIVLPLKFTVLQTDPDPAVPMVVIIAPDLGDGDLFGRTSRDDNEYFDLVKSLGFDVNIKNLAGLNAGRFFLESKNGEDYYRTPAILDFSNPQNKFSLGSEDLEKIKAIYPFIPRVSVEFDPGKVVRIQRNFNIELQSITVKAGGEYTFETGW
jgi:hypothetical protein